MNWSLRLAVVMAIIAWAVWALLDRELPPEPVLPYPDQVVEIGTNNLSVGALIWTPVNRSYFGRVDGLAPSHLFPDGRTRPAVLIYRDRAVQWVPRDRMEHLVRQKRR